MRAANPSNCAVARLASALLLAALAATPGATAAAAPPPTVFLEELTGPELAARIRAGATTVIVPIGGTEQNGPHMTLGKHNARARLLAGRVARELGNAIVAPVVTYVPEGSIDPPSAHMRFPGTISVPERAFEGVLEGAARSFRRHGFRDIVFLGDHGGYRASLAAVAARLNREWAATTARVHPIPEYYRAAEAGAAAALAARGFGAAEIGTHAGLADTSLALAVDPSLVRSDRLADAPAVADGVYGDPRRSSAELGAPLADAIVVQTVAAIRSAVVRR